VIPVSVAGGAAPRWRGDGKEIVFVSLDGKMMGAAVSTAAGIRVSPPVYLFSANINLANGHPYAVANDGKKFLLGIRSADARPTPLTVTTNFVTSARR
jgi:hypothetical protein